jgi:hypothetical protein
MRGVAHVTRLDEQQVLDYVYQMARNPEVDRIALLKQVADVALNRPSEWDASSVRQAMAGVKVTLSGERCWCCRTEARRVYWHHIIQVQNGGSNTPRNMTLLCARCHRDVHPWLAKPDTWENRGFTLVGDWMRRVAYRLEKVFAGRTVFKRNRARWF